jgi:hypothetical protein
MKILKKFKINSHHISHEEMKVVHLKNSDDNRRIARHSGKGKFRNIQFCLVMMPGQKISRKKNSKKIIFVLPIVIHEVMASINWPDERTDRLDRVNHPTNGIVVKASGSTYVTVPGGKITAITTAASNYQNAIPSDEETTFKALNHAVKSVMHLFEEAAYADPEHAVTIIQSGGFHAHIGTGPGAHTFHGEDTATSGEVKLFAPGGPKGKKHHHEWWLSTDGINYTRLQSTDSAETVVHGLTPTTKVWFRHQLIVQDEPQGLSAPLPWTVR